MLKILKILLDKEKELVFSERAKGKFVTRPSSVIMVVFALLYLLSPIDIIPEGLLSGISKLYGFIDDILVLILTGYVVYLDVGGEFNGNDRVSNGKLQKKGKSSRQGSVPSKNESIAKGNSTAVTNNDMQSRVGSNKDSGSDIRHTSDGINFDNNIDNDIRDSDQRTFENEEGIFEERDEFIL